MNRTLQLALALGSFTFAGCDLGTKKSSENSTSPSTNVTAKDVQRDAEKSIKTTAAYSQQNKELLMKNMQAQLATMDANIEKLRLKGLNLVSDSKTKWDASMTDLDEKRKAVKAKLVEVEQSTALAWSDVEKGTQSAWEELKTAFQKASKEY